MGQTTPFLGIYIPAAGETNYDQAWAAGMMNVDQHDHSGGPNKGVPITTSGLGPFSVTYDKLNSNVADPTTGIGCKGPPLQNQLQCLGILQNLFVLADGGATGFISMNGSTVVGRQFTDTASVKWTNRNGISGNPTANVDTTAFFPVTVPNGGTGKTSLSTYDILCGGTTTTGAVQQVSGEGTLNQYLGSNGTNALPSWKNLPTIPAQTLFQASVTMTASQFRNLSGTPIQIVPAQGAGAVILPVSALGKVNIGSASFSSGSSVRFYYGSTSIEAPIRFDSGTFDDGTSGYYFAVGQTVSTSVAASASVQNTPLNISVNSSNFSGGGTSTVTITVFYNVITI